MTETEYTVISIPCFPDWSGDRVVTTITVDKDARVKASFGLPVPASDEEAEKIYGKTIAALVARGVVQQFYGEQVLTTVLRQKYQEGSLETADLTSEVADACKRPGRTVKISGAKELAAIKAASGGEAPEAIARKIAQLKAAGLWK